MESETGSTLSLVGGFLWLIFSILLIFTSLGLVIYAASEDYPDLVPYGFIFLVSGILLVIFGAIAVSSSKWMRESRTVKTGSVMSLIVGILGINILAIMGGIIGLIDSKK